MEEYEEEKRKQGEVYDDMLSWAKQMKSKEKDSSFIPSMDAISKVDENISDEDNVDRAIDSIEDEDGREDGPYVTVDSEDPTIDMTGGDKKEEEDAEDEPVDEKFDGVEDSEEKDNNITGGGFSDEDDDGIFDVQDESLLYSGENQNSISFDELSGEMNEADEKADDDSEESKFNDKKDFSSVNKIAPDCKTPFMAGRLNKTVLLAVIGGVLLVVLLLFYIQSMGKQKAKKENQKSADYMGVEGYQPDFGNYKDRAYKPTKADENKQEEAYIDTVLSGEGKKEFQQEPPKNAYQGASPQKSSGGGKAVKDTDWEEAMRSSIRLSSGGFGSGQGGGQAGYSGAGYIQGGAAANYMPSSSDYADGYLDRIQQITDIAKGGAGNSAGNSLNVNVGRYSEAGSYDSSKEGGSYSFIPENSLYPGTILHAVLVSGINTDYPGNITARIINPVYDSRTGRQLLIPQGSILRGSYSSSSIGVAKVQIAWQSLIINRDGKNYIVDLGSMVGVDKRGYSGIGGSLNDHFFQYVKAAGISCLFTYLNSNIYKYSNAQTSSTKQQMISDSQEIGNKLADKILDRALDIQPTVVVKPGTRVSVDVDKVLTLVPMDNDIPISRYIRR